MSVIEMMRLLVVLAFLVGCIALLEDILYSLKVRNRD